jgi:hypothetical protein
MNHQSIIADIEKELLLEHVSQETKEFIIETLARNIMTRSVVAILETLTDDEATLFESKLNEGNIEEAITFAIEKHQNLEEILKKTEEEVIEEYLQEATKVD